MDKAQRLETAIDALRRTMVAAREHLGDGLQLTRTQLEIIMILSRGAQTTSELARGLFLTQSAVTQTIDTLVRRDLVMREPDANDRRVIRLALSADGQKLSAHIESLRRRFITQLQNDLTTAETDALISATQKLSAILKDAPQPANQTKRG